MVAAPPAATAMAAAAIGRTRRLSAWDRGVAWEESFASMVWYPELAAAAAAQVASGTPARLGPTRCLPPNHCVGTGTQIVDPPRFPTMIRRVPLWRNW